MTLRQLHRFRRLLCTLQVHIQEVLIAARARHARSFAAVAGVTAADTIYQIDRFSENAILGWFEAHWPSAWPVELVMEGLADGESTTVPRGTPLGRTKLKCIIDPIDGTRGLMHDKRSAWALAAIAPQRGDRTTTRDIVVAAMTELPTTKQGRADQFSAVRGGGVVGSTCELRTGKWSNQSPRPSGASDFKHGFASFAQFFTTGKALTAAMEEAFWIELHGGAESGSPLVFDDQYISTGGQLYELLVGHDRMVADLRPLVFAKLNKPSALVCHPYDICTELVLREAGGVVEMPDGRMVDAPLDTTSPVAWIGFANPVLARLARPALRKVIRRYL